MATTRQIVEHWLFDGELCEEVGVPMDWGEPTCWACGYGWNGRYDTPTDASYSRIAKAWKKSPLEKCHIVPKSLDGTDRPENLFLMCRKCHDKAPDTRSRAVFLRWVKSQKSDIERVFDEFQEQAEALGVELDEQAVEVIGSDEFQEFLKGFVSIHATSQDRRGAKMKPSSVIAAYLEFVEGDEQMGLLDR